MMRILMVIALAAASPAFAQGEDPALDDILAPSEDYAADPVPFGAPQGSNELDELSQSSSVSDFQETQVAVTRKAVSVTLRALDKIVAKYTDITIPMGKAATFGTLTITARTCDKRPPEEFPETTAFIEVVDSTPAPESNLKIPVPKKNKSAPAATPASADSHGGSISPVAPASASALPANMIFSGWMFASSPALSALQHPVYDVWVIDCNTVKAGS